MPLPVPTTIATWPSHGLDGSSYRVDTDQLYVADNSVGNINAVTAHTHVATVLGTGFNAPRDVELSADGVHAYVTELPGTLLRLSLTNMNRAAATVVAAGMNNLHQIALDEAHGFAYVAEFGGADIRQINLATGVNTVVGTTPGQPRGVLVTSDGRFIYASDDSGNITRFDLVTKTSVLIAGGLTGGPRFLTWADAGESVILFPQNNGNVYKADLTTSPATVTAIAGPMSNNPYSVAVLSSNQLLIAALGTVSEVDLTASVYSAAGPIFLGIGFVPVTDISTGIHPGYADTTVDPGYFFQVKDCPFGGTLPLMINWQAAGTMGAKFYQVFIAGPGGPQVMVTQAFDDYLWSGALNKFELQPTSPTNGYYLLRSAGQIWLNNWLGLLLDTSGQPNGLNTITIKLFGAVGGPALGTYSAAVMIDNTVPVVNIEQILQYPGNVPINTCAIVNTGLPEFTFQVTASAPGQHLLGWSLWSYWGANQSKAVSWDSYSNHIPLPPVIPTRLWAGITNAVVPPPQPTPWNATVAGPPPDPTSTHCAHSFVLTAWDRVINGWGYIHGTPTYQKFITLYL